MCLWISTGWLLIKIIAVCPELLVTSRNTSPQPSSGMGMDAWRCVLIIGLVQSLEALSPLANSCAGHSQTFSTYFEREAACCQRGGRGGRKNNIKRNLAKQSKSKKSTCPTGLYPTQLGRAAPRTPWQRSSSQSLWFWAPWILSLLFRLILLVPVAPSSQVVLRTICAWTLYEYKPATGIARLDRMAPSRGQEIHLDFSAVLVGSLPTMLRGTGATMYVPSMKYEGLASWWAGTGMREIYATYIREPSGLVYLSPTMYILASHFTHQAVVGWLGGYQRSGAASL